MSTPERGALDLGRPVPADEDAALAVVKQCAGAKADDVIPWGWPSRPVLDLCVLVVALLPRVAELERKLAEHTAAALPDTHPPF